MGKWKGRKGSGSAGGTGLQPVVDDWLVAEFFIARIKNMLMNSVFGNLLSDIFMNHFKELTYFLDSGIYHQP